MSSGRLTLNFESGHLAADNIAVRNNINVKGAIGGGPNGILTLVGQTNLDGNLSITGGVTLSGNIKTPVTTNILVPSQSYPTIQSAIDWFAGRNVMNATITLAPGNYAENLKLDKISSNRPNLNSENSYSGLSIIGDTRNLGGTQFLSGGICQNPSNVSGLGSSLGTVAISNVANIISVTVNAAPLDFVAAGLVVGDHIAILDNSYNWTIVQVTNVSGNQITHDGGTLDVGNSNSSVTLLNNTSLIGTSDFDDFMLVTGSGVTLTGLNFTTSSVLGSQGNAANLLRMIDGASVVLKNCVFDDSNYNLWYFCLHGTNNCKVYGYDGEWNNYMSYTNSFLAGQISCVFLEDNSTLGDGFWTMTDSDTDTLLWLDNSSTEIYGLYQGSLQFACIYAINNSYVFLQNAYTTNSFSSIYAAQNSKIDIGNDSGTYSAYANCTFNDSTFPLLCTNSSTLNINNGQVNINNPASGIILANNSTGTVTTDANIYITNWDDVEIYTDNTSKWTQIGDNVPAYFGFFAVDTGIIVYNGNEYLRTSYPVQALDNSGAPITLYLGPDWGSDWGSSQYAGKKFDIVSRNTQPHTLQLYSKYFVGYGANGTTNTIATFSTPGSYISILVQNNQNVQVLNAYGVTFSP